MNRHALRAQRVLPHWKKALLGALLAIASLLGVVAAPTPAFATLDPPGGGGVGCSSYSKKFSVGVQPGIAFGSVTIKWPTLCGDQAPANWSGPTVTTSVVGGLNLFPHVLIGTVWTTSTARKWHIGVTTTAIVSSGQLISFDFTVSNQGAAVVTFGTPVISPPLGILVWYIV